MRYKFVIGLVTAAEGCFRINAWVCPPFAFKSQFNTAAREGARRVDFCALPCDPTLMVEGVDYLVEKVEKRHKRTTLIQLTEEERKKLLQRKCFNVES